MSLSSLCLKVIKRHFDDFMSDFASANGKVPRWNFEFLQRRYSKELLESLGEKRQLPDHYYSFFINAHLKELDVSLLHHPNADFIIQRLTEIGDTIITLKMERSSYSEDEVKKIVSLVPNIEDLNLAHSNSDDTTIEAINSHAPLRSLNVKSCKKITNVALKYLCEKDDKGHKPNHTLKHLLVDDTAITEEGVMFSLMNFPSLDTLDHWEVDNALYNIYGKHYLEETLDTLPKLNLTTLTLDEDPYEWETKISLVEVLKVIPFLCPKLLSLSLLNLTSSVVGPTWALLSNLQEINLQCLEDIDSTPIIESCGPQLKKITLDGGKLLTDSLLKCSKLEHLSLSNISLPEDLKSQWNDHEFEKMESLTFASLDTGDAYISVIALVKSSPNLQSLTFLEDAFISEDLEYFCNCKCISTLKKLSFNDAEISLASIKKILLHTKCLSELDIGGCDISLKEYRKLISFIEAENNSLKVIGRPRRTSFDYDSDDDYDNPYNGYNSDGDHYYDSGDDFYYNSYY